MKNFLSSASEFKKKLYLAFCTFLDYRALWHSSFKSQNKQMRKLKSFISKFGQIEWFSNFNVENRNHMYIHKFYAFTLGCINAIFQFNKSPIILYICSPFCRYYNNLNFLWKIILSFYMMYKNLEPRCLNGTFPLKKYSVKALAS